MTLSPIIVDVPFDDRDGDGRILFGPANRKKYGTSEATYQGTNAAGEHVYWPKGYTPEVAPPPPPPAPAIKAELLNGEAFLQSDTMTVGFNAFGGIGTLYAAPEGFRTDTATGLKRVGLFRPPLDDAILQGRAIEGFIVEAGAARAANMQLTGFKQIPGSFTDPTRWQGAFNGLHIDQVVTLDGDRLAFAVTLTNRSGKAITGLRYARCADFDQSDKYATTNKVTAPGTVECTLDGSGTVTLRTDDVRAFVAVNAYNKASIIGTTRPVGQSKTADEVVQLVFAMGTLADGAAVTLHSEIAFS